MALRVVGEIFSPNFFVFSRRSLVCKVVIVDVSPS